MTKGIIIGVLLLVIGIGWGQLDKSAHKHNLAWKKIVHLREGEAVPDGYSSWSFSIEKVKLNDSVIIFINESVEDTVWIKVKNVVKDTVLVRVSTKAK